MKLPKLTAVIEPGEDGWYVANCPELGIVSQGETPEHAEKMIKEAVELWLESADESEIRRRLEERKVAIKELEVTHLRVFSRAELSGRTSNPSWRSLIQRSSSCSPAIFISDRSNPLFNA